MPRLISFQASETLIGRIDQFAEEREISRSAVVRAAICEFLKERGY